MKLNFIQFHLPQLFQNVVLFINRRLVQLKVHTGFTKNVVRKGAVALNKNGRLSRHTFVYWSDKKPRRVTEEFDFTRVTIRTLIWAHIGIGPFFIGSILTENLCLEFICNTSTPEIEEHQEILNGRNIFNLGSRGVRWAIPGMSCYRREILLS